MGDDDPGRGLSTLKHSNTLRLADQQASYLEITSMSDIPAGTGLGSSGSFVTALLHALHTHKKTLVPKQELAEQACYIEIERLREPIGKQDQYIAAFGGITCFEFRSDDTVKVTPLKMSAETLAKIAASNKNNVLVTVAWRSSNVITRAAAVASVAMP